MFLKLAIIAGVVILSGMIFLNETGTFSPTAPEIGSLANDISDIGSQASESVGQAIDESVEGIAEHTPDSILDDISNAGDTIANQVAESDPSQIIPEEISNFDPVESIQNIFDGNSSSSKPET